MIYSVVGIPVFLVMFQSVGERLNSMILYLLSNAKRKLRMRTREASLYELLGIQTFFMLTITFVISIVVMRQENWTFFESIYYCFIIYTTIGFGDMVPMQTNNNLTNNFFYACFNIMHVLLALATFAACANLLVLRLARLNAEERVLERLEMDEQMRQAVHLDGDIISKARTTRPSTTSGGVGVGGIGGPGRAASSTTGFSSSEMAANRSRRNQLEQQLVALRATSITAMPANKTNRSVDKTMTGIASVQSRSRSGGGAGGDIVAMRNEETKNIDVDDDNVTVCSCTCLDKLVVCGGGGGGGSAATRNANLPVNLAIR